MNKTQVKKTGVIFTLAIAGVTALPRPAAAQLAGVNISQVGGILGDISNITSSDSSSGTFSLSSLLGNISQVGNVVGLDVPLIGTLSNVAVDSSGNILPSGGGYAWDESIPGGVYGSGNSTYGTTTGIGGLTSAGGLFGTGISQQDIQTATTVANNVQGLYGSISSGNIGGIVNGLKGLLGALGVISPQAASSSTAGQGIPSTGGGSTGGTATPGVPADPSTGGTNSVPSIANAVSPAHARFLGNVSDSAFRDVVGNLAETVLGSKGQQILSSQDQESTLALTMNQSAQQSLNSQLQQSVQATQASAQGAKASSTAAESAQKAVDSQTVLKGISTQMALQAQQNAVSSGQLSVLSANNFEIGTQLFALQAQGKLHHDQLRSLQVLSAAQAHAQVQIANLASRQLQYDQSKDEQAVTGGSQSAAMLYVPGFVPAPQN